MNAREANSANAEPRNPAPKPVPVPHDDTVPETDETMATVFLDQEGRALGIVLPHMSAWASPTP